MRAAYEREREDLAGAAVRSGSGLSLVFVYNAGKAAMPARHGFAGVSKDMSSICRKICAATFRERP